MKLSDTHIGTPLLRLQIRVHHATPRKPTAFERVVLTMADRFASDPNFNAIPLERVFVDILCVPDPAPLVSPTLAELIALGVIHCVADIDRLDMLMLRDIDVTERGKHMMGDDMLPAKSMQNEETFYYDPIRQSLIGESESNSYRKVMPKIAVEASVFDGVFPDRMIRDAIGDGNYRWFSSSSHIEHIESVDATFLWKDTRCSVELINNQLRIESANEDLRHYIANQSPDAVVEQIILREFACSWIDLDRVPLLDSNTPPENIVGAIPRVLAKWPSDAKFVAMRGEDTSSVCPQEPMAGQAIFIFMGGADTSQLDVTWNEGQTGCVIRAPTEMPIPDALRVTDSSCLTCRSVDAPYDQQICRFAIALQVSDYTIINAVVAKLSASFDQDWDRLSKADRAAIVFCVGADGYLRRVLQHTQARSESPADWARSFTHGLIRLQAINAGFDRQQVMMILIDALAQRLSASEISRVHLEDLIDVLARNQKHFDDEFGSLLDAIEKSLPSPSSIDGLNDAIELIQPLDSDWAPSFPSPLFGCELGTKLLKEFPLRPPVVSGPGNRFTNAFHSLLECHAKLDQLIGEKSTLELSDEELTEIVKRDAGNAIPAICAEWFEAYRAMLVLQSENHLSVDDTPVGAFNDIVLKFSEFASKLIGDLDSRFSRVFVLDTCALIENPEITHGLGQHELLVVTKRVIEELDDKKLDESLRPQVRLAVKNLRSLPKNQIQFAEGDMSLLPVDYRTKGDNLILSVAVRFKKHRPVLVTNDGNLSLKAQAEGLEALTSEEFLKRPKRPLGTGRGDQQRSSNLNPGTRRS